MGIRGRAKAGPAAKRAGRRAALNIEHVVELRAIIAEHRHASLDEVTRELDRRTGVQVCTATVRKALRAAGVTRVKPDRKAVAAEPVQPTASPRYGYTQVHRRDAPAHSGQGQAALQGHDRQQARSADLAQSAQSRVHRDRARQGLGGRPHVYRHRSGLALPGRGDRSVQPPGGGLVAAAGHDARHRHRRTAHGMVQAASPQAGRVDLPQRPWQPVRQQGPSGTC